MKRFLALVMALVMTFAILPGCNVVTTTPTGGAAASDAASSADVAAPTTSGDETTQPAQALEGASIVLRMSHGDNDISMLKNTWNCYARVFKKSVELYSGGEMTVDIYPNDQLGSTTSCLEQCSQGTLDIALSASVGALSGWVPNVSLFDIPYLINDIDACNIVCEGEVMEALSTELQDAANMRLLTMIQTDFRNLDSWDAPITSVEDMNGLKMRVQELDPHVAMVDAWGAIPSSVAFTELYSAASTGVIDCYENCNYTLFMNNLYETVNYITETKHAANVCVCVMNQDSWEELTAEQQDIINRAADDARRATSGVVQANNINNLNELEASGVEIISLTADERAAFADVAYEAGKASVINKIDPEFFALFENAYAEAEALLGRS